MVGSATHPDDIPLGPDHPTLDGLPTIHLEHDGEVICSAEWIAGTVHRGAEKLFESRDYRQIVMLVDRHDWLSAFCSEIGVVVGIERALGLTPPPRAQHLRILLCELTRIAHHLAFLAPLPGELPPWWREGAWAWRAEVLELIEAATGQRVHPMFAQVGGVRADVAAGWVARVAAAATRWSGMGTGPAAGQGPAAEPGTARGPRSAAGPGTAAGQVAGLAGLDGPELGAALDSGYAGVALLTAVQAQGFGASGPVARASGVDLDLRRDDPYLPYPPFDVPTSGACDARARIRMLVEELTPSIELVAWASGHLASEEGQPVSVRLPKVVRVPEGASYTWTENPTGINGYLLVSRNDRTPWRLKLRSAGFGNAAALGAALVGTGLQDLPAAVASFLIVCGDVDR